MKIAAIDIGFSGAISIWEGREYRGVMPMPVMTVGKDNELDARKLRDIYSTVDMIVLEKGFIMPAERPDPKNPGKMLKQGAKSQARYYGSYQFLIGLAVGMNIPYDLIPPQTWKKAVLAGMPTGGKNVSVQKVNSLIPGLKIGQNHNKADAILIGYYYTRIKRNG